VVNENGCSKALNASWSIIERPLTSHPGNQALSQASWRSDANRMLSFRRTLRVGLLKKV
jgi:hypothetical protein